MDLRGITTSINDHAAGGRRSRRTAAVLCTALLALAGMSGVRSTDASAASWPRACWSANGYAVSGLTTPVQYYYGGTWRYFGAPSATNGNGSGSPPGAISYAPADRD